MIDSCMRLSALRQVSNVRQVGTKWLCSSANLIQKFQRRIKILPRFKMFEKNHVEKATLWRRDIRRNKECQKTHWRRKLETHFDLETSAKTCKKCIYMNVMSASMH